MTLLLWWAAGCSLFADDPAHHEIQFQAPDRVLVGTDDTYEALAQRFGVEEELLREWNENELLEAGAVLLVWRSSDGSSIGDLPMVGAPAAAVRAPSRAPSRAAPNAAVSGNRCKKGPTSVEEGGMARSVGLSVQQVERAMRPRMRRLQGCLPPNMSGETTVVVDVVVRCTGSVKVATTSHGGGLPATSQRCIEGVFRTTSFPAHDLPDGASFTYPLTFTY